MGTYLSQLSRAGLEKCELANLQQPQQVLQVHRAYLQAGAKALKTNTFAANPAALANDVALLQQVISAGWRLANQAALERYRALGREIDCEFQERDAYV